LNFVEFVLNMQCEGREKRPHARVINFTWPTPARRVPDTLALTGEVPQNGEYKMFFSLAIVVTGI
jgi:hypothetical protein